MSEVSAHRWIASPLLRKNWGDDTLVFNQDSGSTHQITPSAAQVIKFLERCSSATVTDLSEHLAKASGIEVDAELCDQVVSLLENLNELGLVRRIPR